MTMIFYNFLLRFQSIHSKQNNKFNRKFKTLLNWYDVDFLIQEFIYLFLSCFWKDSSSFFSPQLSSPIKRKATSWFSMTPISPKSSKNTITLWSNSMLHGKFILLSRCGHCKKLAPVYLEVADELERQGSPGIIFFYKSQIGQSRCHCWFKMGWSI